MCRHIISFIKGTELRRDLFKSGGIGKKWSTEKFTAFADFEVRAPSSNEILAQQMQKLFTAKILLPMVSWKRGRPKKARALSASEKYHRAGLNACAAPCGGCSLTHLRCSASSSWSIATLCSGSFFWARCPPPLSHVRVSAS